MSQTVKDYVLSSPKQLGIKDVFGVPGDYSFSISDAICTDPEVRRVGVIDSTGFPACVRM